MATKPMSPWWPITLGIASLLLFIAGGALLGIWAGCYDGCSAADYYCGVALIVIAAILKIVWIISLIMYIRSRRYGYRESIASTNLKPYWNASTGLMDGQNFSSQPSAPTQYSFAPPSQTQYSAVPMTAPTYEEATVKNHGTYAAAQLPPQNPSGGIKHCAQCGAAVHTPFCAQCGWANRV
jgi:hypothetical protein